MHIHTKNKTASRYGFAKDKNQINISLKICAMSLTAVVRPVFLSCNFLTLNLTNNFIKPIHF